MLTVQIDETRLSEVVRMAIREEMALVFPNGNEDSKTKKYVYNLKELADFLHISPPVAQRLKNEGKIPYRQTGHKFIYDCDAVMKALEHVDKKKKGK